jgi:hypothetical protein
MEQSSAVKITQIAEAATQTKCYVSRASPDENERT